MRIGRPPDPKRRPRRITKTQRIEATKMRTAKGEKRFSSSQMLTYGPHAGGSPRRVSAGTKSPEEAPLFNSEMWWSGIYCIFRIKITLQRWGVERNVSRKTGANWPLGTRTGGVWRHPHGGAAMASVSTARREEERTFPTSHVASSPCQLFLLQLPHFLSFFVPFLKEFKFCVPFNFNYN